MYIVIIATIISENKGKSIKNVKCEMRKKLFCVIALFTHFNELERKVEMSSSECGECGN